MRTVRLTEAGRRERARLDERSDAHAAAILAPLSPDRRTELTDAMAKVERLLTAATVTLDPLDPDHPDAAYCLRAYAAELAELFAEGFDPAASLLPDPDALRARAASSSSPGCTASRWAAAGSSCRRGPRPRSSGSGCARAHAAWASPGASWRSWRNAPPATAPGRSGSTPTGP